jgi:transposase-like protein
MIQMPRKKKYPENLIEFADWFATNEACYEYLEAIRWPDGFRCPQCGTARFWPVRNSSLKECSACHHQTSVIAGTIFEGTRKPLRLWFFAMWLVTSEKNGISASGLQRELGFSRYETAWTWLHKLRRAMVRPGRDRLSDLVEIDETYVGGAAQGLRGRGADKKSIVVIAVEEKPNGIGRIRLRRIPDASGDSLLPFIKDVVEPNSTIRTDGWKGYQKLSELPYNHIPINISQSTLMADELLPHVHRVASLLKRWLLGTHQGTVGNKYLDYYLDEFTFRFNRRKSRHRGKLFYRLAQQTVQVDPVNWSEIAFTLKNKT